MFHCFVLVSVCEVNVCKIAFISCFYGCCSVGCFACSLLLFCINLQQCKLNVVFSCFCFICRCTGRAKKSKPDYSCNNFVYCQPVFIKISRLTFLAHHVCCSVVKSQWILYILSIGLVACFCVCCIEVILCQACLWARTGRLPRKLTQSNGHGLGRSKKWTLLASFIQGYIQSSKCQILKFAQWAHLSLNISISVCSLSWYWLFPLLGLELLILENFTVNLAGVVIKLGRAGRDISTGKMNQAKKLVSYWIIQAHACSTPVLSPKLVPNQCLCSV